MFFKKIVSFSEKRSILTKAKNELLQSSKFSTKMMNLQPKKYIFDIVVEYSTNEMNFPPRKQKFFKNFFDF